jgi:hypothetical protein
MKGSPKEYARTLYRSVTYDEAKKFAQEQLERNKDQPVPKMFWREVLVELLRLRPRERA